MWAKNSVILVAYLGLCYAFPGKKRRFFSKHFQFNNINCYFNFGLYFFRASVGFKVSYKVNDSHWNEYNFFPMFTVTY